MLFVGFLLIYASTSLHVARAAGFPVGTFIFTRLRYTITAVSSAVLCHVMTSPCLEVNQLGQRKENTYDPTGHYVPNMVTCAGPQNAPGAR